MCIFLRLHTLNIDYQFNNKSGYLLNHLKEGVHSVHENVH